MQILKKSLSVFVVCALLFACLPAVTLPAQAAEAVQTNIWDIESSSVNLTGTYTDTTEQSRNNSAMTSVTGYGINQSMALKYEATEAGAISATSSSKSRSITQPIKLTWANFGKSNPAIQAEDDIFWLWIDAELSSMQRFTLQLQGQDILIQSGETYIYTIVNSNGTAAMQKIAYSADPVNPVDPVDGIDLVNANGFTNGATIAQIRMTKDWSGWIGIPLNMLKEVPAVGTELTYFSLMLNQYTLDDMIERQKVGDAVYMDEFWLTSAGTMPNLTNDELLYNGDLGRVTFALASRYQNNMIFQQKEAWMVHGTAPVGETVTVKLLNGSTEKQTKTAEAGSDGTWSVTMDAVTGGYTAYSVTATCGSTTKTISNVVFGEVWVTSGQSNMYYKISHTNDQNMFGSQTDVAELQTYLENNPTAAGAIRMYYYGGTPLADFNEEATDVPGTWHTAATWSHVNSTSAVAMHYAKKLQAELDMPVGVVVAARGGTSIGTWVDADVAANYSSFSSLLSSYGYLTDESHQYRAYGYYNAHIAPWQGYNVAGLLWYQGEQDRFKPKMQELGFEVMVESFSRTFTTNYSDSGLMDVMAMQIAPFFGYTSSQDADLMTNTKLNAAMRTGAAKVQAKGGNVALIPIYDLPTVVDDHHPLNKEDVAKRITQVAMEIYYDSTSGNEVYSGPKPVSAVMDNGDILVTFDQNIQCIYLTETNNQRLVWNEDTKETYNNLLSAADLYAQKLDGFSVYTGDEYVSLDGVVEDSNKVRLTLPDGTAVQYLTYAYGLEVLSANLYDTDGLPALPFTTTVEAESVSYREQLWNGTEMGDGETIIVESNAWTGEGSRNTSKITIDADEGLNGSQGLKYELVNSGNDRTNTWRTTKPGEVMGLNTQFTVINSDDIIWFWAHSKLSTVQRLQIGFNDSNLSPAEDAYIYTLECDRNGKPVTVKIPYGGKDSVDGISLMRYTDATSQIQLEPDWYGWIGIPVNMLNNVDVGDAITTFSVLLLQRDDSDYSKQQIGDALIIDEIWLTSSDKQPVVEDMIDFRVSIVDFEHSSLSDGMVLEKLPAGNAANDTMITQITGDIGVGESNALAYIFKTAVYNNSDNIHLTEDTLGAVYNKPKITDSSNILWFWVDSDLPVDRLLHVQVNNQHLAVNKNIYTIGTGSNGKPEIQTVEFDADGTVQGDGLALVHYLGGNGAYTDTYARIRLDANWCGWIGIPIGNFTYKDGTVTAPSGYLSSITLRLYDYANSILEGEAVFFDEFWLTEAGMMPALSASKLPYSTEHQTSIWDLDESDAALTDPFVIDNAARNQAVISRMTEQGVLGSNSLQYTLADLVSDTGDNRLDLTETLKLIDNESTDTNELSANGFTTGVKVTAETDILWFWIDSDMSRNMRIQPGVNNLGIRGGFEESNPTELSVNKNIWVYTIENVNGVPTMKRLYQESCAAIVDGVGLVNSSRGDHGEVSQLKFTEGWSGWIGIPLNMLYDYADPTAKISVGDTIREITLQMRIYNGVDGSMYKQVENESMYIDEFWLTTVWMMPDLTDEELLYKDPEVPMEDGHLLSPETADCYIDLINADAGNLVKTADDWTSSASQTKDQFSFEVVKGKGYLGGNAFSLGFAGTNVGNYTNWGHVFPTNVTTISELGITGGTNVKTSGMLWFWVDGSDLSTDARLDVRLNGQKNDYSGVYYTIVAGSSGYYLTENALVATGTNSTGTITGGVDGVVPVAQGFQGWIGIPLESYFFDTTNMTIAETVDIQKISFHLKKTGDGAKHTAGSTIYISDLYIADTYTAGSVTTWEIPPMAELKFSSASLVLQNGISVKFKAKPGLFVDESVEDTIFYHNPYAIFTLHDVVNVIPGVYNAETGMYEFTYYNIRPDWMGDDINAYLYAYRDGTLYRSAEVKLYSVEDYCYNMLNRYYGDAAADGNDALGDLLVDVLKYGGAAQSYTGHNTGALVTAGLSGTAWENWGNQQTLNLTSHQQITAAVETPAAAWKGAALFLRETTRIRLNFTTDLTDALTVVVKTVDGTQSWEITDAQMVKSGTSRFVFFDGLYATQMHQPVTFQVYSGDTPVSNILTYSVETYARSAINGSNALLKDLMTALIRYGDSAIAYVNSVS